MAAARTWSRVNGDQRDGQYINDVGQRNLPTNAENVLAITGATACDPA